VFGALWRNGKKEQSGATIMSTAADRITMDALALPPDLREILAYQLLQSLEKEPLQPDVLENWITEADRRLKEIEDGTAQCIPAEEVFREMREKFG
jgi:putative addiction module component (TIGR02574 family)